MKYQPVRMMIYPFEKEFMSCTSMARHGRLSRLFAGAVHIGIAQVNSETVRITNIEILSPRLRRKGLASEAIDWLGELADAHNVKLSLTPASGDRHAMSTVQLTAWYQRHGFVRIGMQDEMLRYPNGGFRR